MYYHLSGYDDRERGAFALLGQQTAGDIVEYLLANGSSSPATIAADLEIARSKRRNSQPGVCVEEFPPIRTAGRRPPGWTHPGY